MQLSGCSYSVPKAYEQNAQRMTVMTFREGCVAVLDHTTITLPDNGGVPVMLCDTKLRVSNRCACI